MRYNIIWGIIFIIKVSSLYIDFVDRLFDRRIRSGNL